MGMIGLVAGNVCAAGFGVKPIHHYFKPMPTGPTLAVRNQDGQIQ